MTTVTISEARATLPALIDRVGAGDEITITRHGAPVATLGQPKKTTSPAPEPVFPVDDIDAFAKEMERMLAEARRNPIVRGISSDPGWADEVVAWIRAGRDEE